MVVQEIKIVGAPIGRRKKNVCPQTNAFSYRVTLSAADKSTFRPRVTLSEGAGRPGKRACCSCTNRQWLCRSAHGFRARLDFWEQQYGRVGNSFSSLQAPIQMLPLRTSVRFGYGDGNIVVHMKKEKILRDVQRAG
jgi:hypothetical protein